MKNLKYEDQMHNLILFASGGGSNVMAIYKYFQNNPYVKVALIVCNRPNAGVLTFAEKENIPTFILDKINFSSDHFIQEIQSYQPSLIVLAGFLWKVPQSIIAAFPEKIINLHPALLPKYGGKGMYGERVHQAVLAAQETETGITIHFIDEQYDQGSTIVQAYCRLSKKDGVSEIMKKIQKLEHHFLPRTIEYLLSIQN